MNLKVLEILNNSKIKNALWMILEKVVSIFGLIFVTSFVAKYIGPDNFGKLTLTSSIFAIIQTIAMFGLENIIFHQTARKAIKGEKLIFASQKIRNVIFIICSLIVLTYFYFSMDRIVYIFAVATCIAIYFALRDMYTIYFNAVLRSRINTICNSVGLIIALFCRYIIAEFELNIEYLGVPIILTTLIPYLLRRRIYFHTITLESSRLSKYQVKKYRLYMLGVGKKLLLYSLAVSIFTKTSQLFLGWHSTYELGLYTVLITLGTSFGFIFNALASSFMTEIYQDSNFESSQKKVAQLNLMIILLGICILIGGILFGKSIIGILYGDEYISVSYLLPIMIITCILSGISTVAEKYLVKFGAYDYLQKKTNILLIVNVVITFVSVKYFGLLGAVIAIFLTELLTSTIFNYFFKSGIIFNTHKRVFMPSSYFK